MPRAAKKIEPEDSMDAMLDDAQAALDKLKPPDHNGETELTEAEKRALLVRGLAEIERLTGEKNTLVSNIRTERKRLIGSGFKSSLITYALRLRKSPEAEEIEHRRAEAEIARFLNHPIGTQPEFSFTSMVDRTPLVDWAFADGETAGAEGKSCESPIVGGPNEQAWIKGWHEGQATILSAFGKLEAKAQADAADEEEGED